jgi:hypothetical protein
VPDLDFDTELVEERRDVRSAFSSVDSDERHEVSVALNARRYCDNRATRSSL